MKRHEIGALAASLEGAARSLMELCTDLENDRRHNILRWAKQGDWPGMAGYIEQGGTITEEMREFLVAVLRGGRGRSTPGRAKRSNNRPPKLRTDENSWERTRFVVALEESAGLSREAAIGEAMSKFNKNRRTIQRDLRESGAIARKHYRAITHLQECVLRVERLVERSDPQPGDMKSALPVATFTKHFPP